MSTQTTILEDSDGIAATFKVGNQIQLQKEVGADKIDAFFSGWVFEEHVTVCLPPGSSAFYHFFQGNMLFTRYVEGGVVYGFRARVYKMIPDVRLILLLWPQRLEVLPVRSGDRMRVRFPILFHVRCTDHVVRGFAGGCVDISEGGCRVEIAKNKTEHLVLKVGQKVVITRGIDGVGKRFNIMAEIRNMQAAGAHVSVGMSWCKGQEEKCSQVEQMVKSFSLGN